ncbi:unnamed protein product [Caenorhabditis bovis]|uniref:Uncharacterized protein n=1 Tax=Caenorhabditis bovis TaxID=2654633 RepID=A0A8S1ESJ4_9PELO|nr:unnamed protein product [Caenorhabditis bovis]
MSVCDSSESTSSSSSSSPAANCIDCVRTRSNNVFVVVVRTIDQYVQQLPLMALAFLPLISAILGLRFINLKSVIHFQQGTLGNSPWRAATAMTILSIPPFFIWCLCARSPAAMFFQAGASLALVLTTITSSPILHYLPSTSITKYFQLRYLSNTLEFLATVFQCGVLCSITVILLYVAASFLSSITSLSIYLILPLVAYFSLFSVIFSGHSSIMNFSFILHLLVTIAGILLFLYYAIEEIPNFEAIVPVQKLNISGIISSTLVGFIVNFHLLNSSILYQVYSPMPTMHKLRLTLTFYGVFQLFISFFVFLVATLFLNFLNDHCKFSMSFSSFFQFVKTLTTYKYQAFAVCASLLCILLFCIQWSIMCFTTIVWEECLAKKLRNWNPIQQLCSLQFAMLILTTALVVVTVAAKLSKIPIATHLPTISYVIFSAFALLAGIMICGYYFPFCSSRGVLVALFLTLMLTLLNLTIYMLNNTPETFHNSCVVFDDVTNSTTTSRSISMDRVVYFVSHLPPQAQPTISLIIFVVSCIFISFLTGGQDQMGLDWNLIAFTWAASVRSPTSFSKRPFVDSESFRYAQQQNSNPTPSPDINIYR